MASVNQTNSTGLSCGVHKLGDTNSRFVAIPACDEWKELGRDGKKLRSEGKKELREGKRGEEGKGRERVAKGNGKGKIPVCPL